MSGSRFMIERKKRIRLLLKFFIANLFACVASGSTTAIILADYNARLVVRQTAIQSEEL